MAGSRKERDARYRERYPEKERLRMKKFLAANPQKPSEYSRRFREKHPEKKGQYYANNKSRCREVTAKWRSKNPDKVKMYAAKWCANNPDSVNTKTHRRRSRIRCKIGNHTTAQWKALVDFYHGQCLRCGSMCRKLTRDHIIPIVKGGSNRIDNIQPLCGPCNSAKGDSDTDYR